MDMVIQEFDAVDEAGNVYQLLVVQNYATVHSGGRESEIPTTRELRCNGDHVRRLSKGKYRLMRSRITDPSQAWEVDLSSDAHDAP